MASCLIAAGCVNVSKVRSRVLARVGVQATGKVVAEVLLRQSTFLYLHLSCLDNSRYDIGSGNEFPGGALLL